MSERKWGEDMRAQPSGNAHTAHYKSPKPEITTFDFPSPESKQRKVSDLQPFSMLLPNERFAELPDELKVEYFAQLRDQMRRLLQLTRTAGLEAGQVLDALWGES
jgi:hypothetical protein